MYKMKFGHSLGDLNALNDLLNNSESFGLKQCRTFTLSFNFQKKAVCPYQTSNIKYILCMAICNIVNDYESKS